MTATLLDTARTSARTSARTGLVPTGLVATALASVATTTLAATGHAAGISLDMAGEPVPVSGFALLTAVFSLVGLALAAVLSRRARHPRGTFVRTTVALTALSLVPDALADSAGSTIALLMTAHLVAAAIVVPALARRLSV